MSILSRSLSSLLSVVLVLGPSLQAQIPGTPSEAAIQELHLRPTDDTLAEYAAGSSYGPGMVIEVTDQRNAPVLGAAVTFRFPETGSTGAFADGSRVAVAYTDAAGHAAFRNIQWGNTPGTLLLRVTVTKGIVHAGILVEQKLTASAARVPQYAVPLEPQRSVVPPVQVAAPQVSIGSAAAVQPMEPVARPQPGQPQYAASQGIAAPLPAEPSVSITNTSGARSGARSSKKWLWVALIGAGAGAGAVLAMGKAHVGSTSSSTSSGSGVSIGTPGISIGHP
jgi:hypothetical protein